MRVLEALASAKRRFSIEVVPPARGGDLDLIKAAVETVMPWEPAFVSVTDHAPGQAWVDGEGGPTRVALRTRPGTLGTSIALRETFRVTAMPHLVAVGADRLSMEDLLIDLHHAGFHDVFAVRGDDRAIPAAEDEDPCSGGSYSRAEDLVRHVGELNAGRFSPPAEGKPTAFVVGVAGYPERHFASPDLETDLDIVVGKVEAGAKFIITQMIFHASGYRLFVEALRARGVDLPIVPGIKPLLRRSSLSLIPRSFHVTIPEALVRAMEAARTPSEERRVGIDWAVRLGAELFEAGAPCLHYFTMGRGEVMANILEETFGKA